jgi:predicted enzyme related to lactoylglutathione lyase
MRLIINIDVDDLDKAIAFYSDGLGLTLGRRLFDGSIAEMDGAVAPIQLLTKAAGGVRDYARHWTPVHLDFDVDDIDEAMARAAAAGARLEGEVRRYSWGAVATMSDPFGHGFCLLQLIGDGYDGVTVPT